MTASTQPDHHIQKEQNTVFDTTAAETVIVPKSVLGPVLTTHLHAYGRDENSLAPEVSDAIRTVFNLTNTPAVDEDNDTVRLGAETAWILAFHCLAEDVYSLDETDEATYQHPAVEGRHALMKLIADQAPETDARLNAAAEAAIR